MGTERKAGAGTTDDGQNTCALYAREQLPDGGCAFIANMVKFGRVDTKRAKKKEGAEERVVGKRPSDGSGDDTGGKESKIGEGTGEDRAGGEGGGRRGRSCLLYTSDAADD